MGVDVQDQLFYTMKMVRGITLKKVLELLAESVEATVKKYSLPALLTIFQKACDAVAFAHARGVIHRDLKPENITLGDFGSVIVMDWGLAKVMPRGDAAVPGGSIARSGLHSARAAEPEFGSTMAGAIMGTPTYMSLEQARGQVETLDARSDIFALGAILFHLLCLRPPVSGSSALEIVEKVRRGEVEWAGGRASSRADADAARRTTARGDTLPPTRHTPESLFAVPESTARIDTSERRMAYLTVSTLEACVIADSTERAVTVWRRTGDGWAPEIFTEPDALLTFVCAECALSLGEIYEGTGL